jgi:hypothetical protein
LVEKFCKKEKGRVWDCVPQQKRWESLTTFQKIRRWLKGAPAVFQPTDDVKAPQVHFRREKTVSPEMAQSLAQMILHAQTAWGLSRASGESSE